ncbi:MAG: ribonuclease HII, partial [Alicyclobacillus sp.]|nr:ribonuclease HII [Alicyclobacillus sp.]
MGGETQEQRRRAEESLCQALWDGEQALVAPGALYAGVDEAGRGCLAGPVVAAAVVLQGPLCNWIGVNDSKQRTRRQRETLYDRILDGARAVGVGIATVEEIDTYNILHASRIAMGRAIADLHVHLDTVLVDGPYPPEFASSTANCSAVPV